MTAGALQSLYQQMITDHSQERHGFGLQATAEAESHELNASCGDEVTLQLHLEPSSNHVTPMSWEAEGCVISTASASMLSDLVRDLTPTDVASRVDYFLDVLTSGGTIEPDEDLLGDAVALQGVAAYPARIKCAMLAWIACEDALSRLEKTAS